MMGEIFRHYSAERGGYGGITGIWEGDSLVKRVINSMLCFLDSLEKLPEGVGWGGGGQKKEAAEIGMMSGRVLGEWWEGCKKYSNMKPNFRSMLSKRKDQETSRQWKWSADQVHEYSQCTAELNRSLSVCANLIIRIFLPCLLLVIYHTVWTKTNISGCIWTHHVIFS